MAARDVLSSDERLSVGLQRSRGGRTGQGTTVHDLRRRNRAIVMRDLVRTGESTRADLAASGGMSAATLTNVVTDLIAEGVVEEIGHVPSGGGRPIARLSPRAVGAYFVGVDVGEHGVTAELFDLLLHRVDRVFAAVPRGELEPGSMRSAISDSIGSLRDRNPVPDPMVVGVGVGLPGMVGSSTGVEVTVEAQSLGWPPVGLREIVEVDGLPVYAENGAKAMLTAEAWRGAAQGASHAVAALVGRGVGAGILHDGRLVRGVVGGAGEWGHTKIVMRGRQCRCGSQGCLEAYVGSGSIVERWAESGAVVTGSDEEAIVQLLAAADRDDATARRCVDETVEILGIGLANVVNTLNPEVIVLGGWLGSMLAGAEIDAIREHMRSNALARSVANTRLVVSELGGDAVALGAALLPLQEMIEGRLVAPSRRTG